MTAIEVQHTIKSGQVVKKVALNEKGNSLILSWGDQEILGPMGHVYRLGWDCVGSTGLWSAFMLWKVGWGLMRGPDKEL